MAIFKVRYVGLSDVRSMSVQELATRGVGVAADLVWDRAGRLIAPPVFIKDPSDELLEIFRAEGTFQVAEVVEGEAGPVEGDPVVEGKALDDTGANVIDGNTGQVSTAPGADPVAGAVGQKAKDKNA